MAKANFIVWSMRDLEGKQANDKCGKDKFDNEATMRVAGR